MKIICLGGNGFIGSNLIEKVLKNTSKKVDVLSISLSGKNENCKTICIDMRNKDSVNSIFLNNKPDIVIDLLGYSLDSSYYDSIINGPLITGAVCDALIQNKFKGRFVFLSSVDDLCKTKSSLSYNMSETILNNTKDVLGFSLAVVRVPIVYGLKEKPDGDFINRIIENLLIGEKTVLASQDSETRVLYIDYLTKYIVALLKSKKEKFNNIHNLRGELITFGEIATLIKNTIGYGDYKFSDYHISYPCKESEFEPMFKVADIPFNEVIESLVENRKNILMSRGYRENKKVS